MERKIKTIVGKSFAKFKNVLGFLYSDFSENERQKNLCFFSTPASWKGNYHLGLILLVVRRQYSFPPPLKPTVNRRSSH